MKDVIYCYNCGKNGHYASKCPQPQQTPPAREVVDARSPDVSLVEELLVRLANLERVVDELLAGKRKRSEYMAEYMRKRRSEG